MGIDSSATIGYGFKIVNKKLAQKLTEINNEGWDDSEEDEEDDVDDKEYKSAINNKNFEIAFSGDSCADNEETFIFIKKSTKSTYCWDDVKNPLPKDFLVTKDDWNIQLIDLAKSLKIPKPKIGWWLISSLS